VVLADGVYWLARTRLSGRGRKADAEVEPEIEAEALRAC
jgi:hypothetical protein